MTGAPACVAAQFAAGACRATYNDRKSHQRSKVAGSNESTCVPFVNVNHLRCVPLKCSAKSGQCPPVCSSVNWQAMNVGTLILLTKLIGDRWSATAGT